MDSNQPTATTHYAPKSVAPGMFGTKIPSSVAFAVGLLLFLLPLAEIKCGGTKLASKTGLDYTMGKEWKINDNGMLGGKLKEDKPRDEEEKMDKKKNQLGNTQYFAIGALALGAIGLLLCFGSAKTAAGGVATGVLAAGALIGLMLDEKNNFKTSLKNQALDKAQDGAGDLGFDKIGNTMGDLTPTLGFTPWFYVAVVAFLAAAIFCYQRMRSSKT